MATLSKGYDLEYVWRQVNATAPGRDGYYLEAAGHGEPPGRWWGPGAAVLGLTTGQVVERAPYLQLFGERKAPDGTMLGRSRPGARVTARDVYVRLLAAEPHATSERRQELLTEAAGRARVSPAYFDLTISFSKSVSVFHASLGENARLAREAGDAAGEAYWAGLVGEMEEMIWQAVHSGFGYFQREAGWTRTGSHASRAGGRETGQWREADLAVAHWLQHTSRDGDMQLHVHSQIAHVARSRHDGKWRAPDSYGYAEHLGAVAAVTAQHLEEALTRRFGVAWTPRRDGHGFEIAGIPERVMRVFSTRRVSITAATRERARVFEARYGRAPGQRELARLAQAANFATRGRKDDAGLDFGALHAQWAQRLKQETGLSLAAVAPSVWGETSQRPRLLLHGNAASTERAVARRALEMVQQHRSAWTRADLIAFLGRVMPRTGTDPGVAARRLEELADRALAGEFGPVTCLEAPDPVPVPAGLIRADGRSVFRRHGGTRYAVGAELAQEERLVSRAQARGAPAITRVQAARILGADQQQLDAALTGHAQARHAPSTQVRSAGLRTDQSVALYAALTDDRRVTVLSAPAGSGKTRVLAAAARTWTATGNGAVVGIAPSQAARNTLVGAGVTESFNCAQFLGHLPGQPGAREPVPLAPGTLILADEASMISVPDLAAITAHAETRGAKVVLAGDLAQLQPVGPGGGMAMLAGALGYVQLTEPVRFTAGWEREASLRLRAGDPAAAAVYDEHGRLTGGDPEQVMEAAARAYVAYTLEGRDALLIAAEHARRRELSRRVRDDLISLGLVDSGRAAVIASGEARASRGDLITCTRNRHDIEAGAPGLGLANGDLLRVEKVTAAGLLVRRALETDTATGRRRWMKRCFLYSDYHDCELGYAVTTHAAQSRTVHTGLALITGAEDRQHAYVALSRGTHRNQAYVFTRPANTADPAPGTRPAPELDRYDRLTAAGDAPEPVTSGADEQRKRAAGVLAQVISRNGQEPAATTIRDRNLSDADHLAVLYAIWHAETSRVRQQRYADLLSKTLPPGFRGQDAPRARWLWRTLHAGELAGLDPAALLAEAVSERSLTGARDIAAVIDARIRRRSGTLTPEPAMPWTRNTPAIPDPELRQFLTSIAAAMSDRARRIGEHAADHALPWAVTALGPVPADTIGRRAWRGRAAVIGAWRELSGRDDAADLIGPQPAGDPARLAAWHAAIAALPAAADGDIRGMPDGQLLELRGSYQAQTAGAPRWAAGPLRQARLAGENARLAAIRAGAEAQAAAGHGDHARAARRRALAGSYQALHRAYRQRETVLGVTQGDRAAWNAATWRSRHLAVAADAELRRRHARQKIEPLRSAEPEPVTVTMPGAVTAGPAPQLPVLSPPSARLAAEHAAFLGRTTGCGGDPVPAADAALGGGWPRFAADAILQPPLPPIPPATRILGRAAAESGREPDREAAS